MDSHEKRTDSERPERGGDRLDAAAVIGSPVLEAVTRAVARRLSKNLPERSPDVLLPAIPDEDLDAFCDLLIQEQAEPAQTHFSALRRSGTTVEALCLSYIAPAARRLGDRWVADDASFLEVTLGSTRLHGLLRTLRPDFTTAKTHRFPAPVALFAAVPGETHVLGMTMAADFFRRAGWIVDLAVAPDDAALCDRARTGGYDLIGLTAGCEAAAADLDALIARLRSAAPASKLVLGGHLGTLDPGLVARLDLDAILTDVINAPFACQTLLTTQNGQ